MPYDTKNDNNTTEKFPREPARVRAFADFFKRYMSISSVVAAALPVPVTAISLIPTYSAHIKLLSTYTPMLCFLMLGYIFYMRQKIGVRMFGVALTSYHQESFMRRPETLPEDLKKEQQSKYYYEVKKAHRGRIIVDVLPFLLILFSIGTILAYHYFLDLSINDASEDTDVQQILFGKVTQKYQKQYDEWLAEAQSWIIGNKGPEALNEIYASYGEDISSLRLRSLLISKLPPELRKTPTPENRYEVTKDPDYIMKNTPLSLVPRNIYLIFLYIMFFASAEAAFIFMAVKEYIQDLLRLHDTTILTGDAELAFEEINRALLKSDKESVHEN